MIQLDYTGKEGIIENYGFNIDEGGGGGGGGGGGMPYYTVCTCYSSIPGLESFNSGSLSIYHANSQLY